MTNRPLAAHTYLKRNEMLLKKIQAVKFSISTDKLHLTKIERFSERLGLMQFWGF